MESENPYAAPESKEALDPIQEKVVPPSASHALRMFNFIIDCAIIIGAAVAWGLVFGTYDENQDASGPGLLAGYALIFGYYVILEGLTGRTLGKLITGTKVVNGEGDRLTISQLLVKNLARFIPFEPFSFLGAEPEGWHDTLSRSFVVKCR